MRTVILLLLLTGCATQAVPEPKVTTVYVQIPLPCIERAPDRPALRYGQGAYPGDKEAAAILADDFERVERYGQQWEAAAAGCFIVRGISDE